MYSDDIEYYRIKDKENNLYLSEGYNTQDLNCVKRIILKFLIDSKNDMDELSKLNVIDLLNIEGLDLDLESSYEPFEEVDNIARYVGEDEEINIFPKLEKN